ncbi:MAG: hypothetical protein QOI66_3756 [Myxococcales bacterium]|jgi:hypothetical protein|nr:hypothetical protein [Myxococcales bacterium]
MKRLAAGLLMAAIGGATMGAAGCRAAEPFFLSFDSGIFVSQGSGGRVGGTGGDVITVPGTGGMVGSGGDVGDVGAPEPDAGEDDATPAADLAAVPDALPPLPDLGREVPPPEGPFTPIDCLKLASYKPDDQSYGPDTTVFSLRDLRVYKCMKGLESGWCTLGAYEPGLPIDYWRDCWIPIGYCQ